MSILICFALKEEAAPFQKIAAKHPGVVPVIVGIGRANAESSIRRALTTPVNSPDNPASPDLVITCGFAGGLNPKYQLGDVLFELFPTELATSPISSPILPADLTAKLMTAGAQAATFFCADRIATTVAEKQALRAATGADAVEMESAAIHAVCRERSIPCVTVRVISDTAGENLPLDFNVLAKPDRSLDFQKLFWAIAKAPWKISALLALQKKTTSAAQQLATVLEKVISP